MAVTHVNNKSDDKWLLITSCVRWDITCQLIAVLTALLMFVFLAALSNPQLSASICGYNVLRATGKWSDGWLWISLGSKWSSLFSSDSWRYERMINEEVISRKLQEEKKKNWTKTNLLIHQNNSLTIAWKWLTAIESMNCVVCLLSSQTNKRCSQRCLFISDH